MPVTGEPGDRCPQQIDFIQLFGESIREKIPKVFTTVLSWPAATAALSNSITDLDIETYANLRLNLMSAVLERLRRPSSGFCE